VLISSCRQQVLRQNINSHHETIAIELNRITTAATYAANCGLIVNAGHGLHYQNVQAIAALPEINELNIGHAIIAQAIFSGLEQAVREMKHILLST